MYKDRPSRERAFERLQNINAIRARAAALAFHARMRPSLTSRLMGDPHPGRSALDRSRFGSLRTDVATVETVGSVLTDHFGPIPVLATELIEDLGDSIDCGFRLPRSGNQLLKKERP